MAIAFDAVSSNKFTTPGPTLSHTCSGTDRVLIVAVAIVDSGGVNAGVAYNNVTMTQIGTEVVNSQSGDDVWVSMWRLVAPDTGAHNISVDTFATPAHVFIAGMSFTGVDQTTPIEADSSDSADAGNSTVTVATVSDNAWVVSAVGYKIVASTAPTLTAQAGVTEKWNLGQNASSNSGASAGGYSGPKTPTGNVTHSWSSTNANGWASIGAALKPAAGAPAYKDDFFPFLDPF